MTDPRTRNACTPPEMQVTQKDRAGSLSQPPALHSNDPSAEDRAMPTRAHVAQHECARNPEQTNNWQSLGDVASRVVASVAAKGGVK